MLAYAIIIIETYDLWGIMKKTISIRIDDKLIGLLRGYAYFNRVTIAEVVDIALRLFLQSEGNDGKPIHSYKGRIAPGRKIKM